MCALKSLTQQGTVVDLPTVPHQFLREAPLVAGDWIDRYIVELAEWGARINGKGFLLEESQEYHPMAWHRIIDPADGLEVDTTVTMKLWQQTRKHLASFSGRTNVIDERTYLSFKDYLMWPGRRNKSDLKSGMLTGLLVDTWNQWVEGNGDESVAILVDTKVGKLDCYADGYRYRQRVEHWKELVLRILPEIYTLRGSITSINQRYFEGQEILFPAEAEGFDQLVALVEKLIANYNEDLAGSLECVEELLDEVGDGHRESLLTICLSGLIENVMGAAKEQVAYLVDMAKADALDILGDTRQALNLVDRHV